MELEARKIALFGAARALGQSLAATRHMAAVKENP
jgi:hypothetical protein